MVSGIETEFSKALDFTDPFGRSAKTGGVGVCTAGGVVGCLACGCSVDGAIVLTADDEDGRSAESSRTLYAMP